MSSRMSSLLPLASPSRLLDGVSTPSLPTSDTDKIFVSPRINSSRILVIGRAGAGKSTLCRGRIAGDSYPKALDNGGAWEEVRYSYDSGSIIFHDHRGFQTGATDLVQDVDKLIQQRRNTPKIEDQIHCIWYCISCVDGRSLRSSEKRLFQKFKDSQIPLVVIFTQFDRLVKEKAGTMIEQYQHDENITKPHLLELGYSQAEKHYRESLYRPLKDLLGNGSNIVIRCIELPPGAAHTDTLDSILADTRRLLTDDTLETLLTAAQRVDADSKLEASLSQGTEAFWQVQGWGAVPLLPGAPLMAQKMALKKVYRLIYQTWGLPAAFDSVFEERSVRHKLYEACFDASTAVRVGTDILRALDITGPVTASLSMKTLLMLVISVSLICESLFWKFWGSSDHNLKKEDVINAIENYYSSEKRAHAMDVVSRESRFMSHAFDKGNCLALLRKAIKGSRSDGNQHTQNKKVT